MLNKTLMIVVVAGLFAIAAAPAAVQAALDRSTVIGGRVVGKVIMADGTDAGHLNIDLQSLSTRSLRARTLTNMDGQFETGIIPADKYVVTISRSGYVFGTTNVTVENGKTTYVTVRLVTR